MYYHVVKYLHTQVPKYFNFLVMMKSKDVVAGDSENEYEVDEPEELSDNSDGDEWAPSTAVCMQFINECTVFYSNIFQVKTPGKRGRPAKTPGRKKKKASEDEEDEVLPKKTRGAKPKKSTPAKGRVKTQVVIKTEPLPRPVGNQIVLGQYFREELGLDDAEEDDCDYDEEEEELNQGPNAKPAKKFTVRIL